MNAHGMKSLGLAFGLSGLLLQATCAVFLWNRKLYRDYLFFFCYLLFQVVLTVPLLLLYMGYVGNGNIFFYVYWVQSAAGDIFAFAVLYELFCAAFKPFPGLRDLGQIVFRWAAVALLLVGLAIFFSSSLPNRSKVELAVANIERTIYVMQIGLLLFLFIGSSYLGLSRRSHIFGISLGFGILACVNLVVVSIGAVFGYCKTPAGSLVNFLPSACWTLVSMLWAGYLAMPEQAREAINVPVTSPLLRWNEAAMALGHSGGRVAFIDNPEPFMPSVERMVEEVMKKDMSARRT